MKTIHSTQSGVQPTPSNPIYEDWASDKFINDFKSALSRWDRQVGYQLLVWKLKSNHLD